MATALRQRIPFQFNSADGELDDRVLDEQEQEELIDRLRNESDDSSAVYFIGLQVIVGLSLFIHTVYLLSPTKVSPLAVFFPGSPSTPVPLAAGLTLLQILIHLNLGASSLPPNHHYRRLIPQFALPYRLSVPLPLSHPAALILPVIAPMYAAILGRGRADVLWWSVTGILTGVVALVLKWMRDGEKDLQELEKLRYAARGA